MAYRTAAAIVLVWRADFDRLLAIAGSVAPEARAIPVYEGWTVKDIVAHVAY